MPDLRHVGQLAQAGAPPAFSPPPPGFVFPGHLLYLPATTLDWPAPAQASAPAAAAAPAAPEAGATGGGKGSAAAAPAAAAAGGSAAAAVPLQVVPYRKVPPPCLAKDPTLLAQLLATEPGGGGAGQAAPAEGGGEPAPTSTAAAAAAGARAVAPVVCLAASAFACLASTPMWGDGVAGWELPIEVAPFGDPAQQAQRAEHAEQAQKGPQQQQQRLAVFVDKPLVTRCMAMRAKQVLHSLLWSSLV